jgi:hypothetical protein
MNDENPKKKNLSEISHLFLSSVRDNATGGFRPKRLPPGAPRSDVSVDLTPEEYAQVFGNSPRRDDPEKAAVAPVRAVISAHLNGKQFDRVKEYARHLAVGGKRIGLIEVDASEFRVMCFDRTPAEVVQSAGPIESYDPRQMAESLEELACDIDQWILLLPNPRTPEARALLRQVNHWVLLSTCDHDGVVSCYRAIKGLADAHRPRLTLALLNPNDQAEAGRVYRKVASVCQQFLHWTMEAESAVQPAVDIAEHLVLLCRPNRDKSSVAIAPQWQIVGDFLARAKTEEAAHMNDTVEAAEESELKGSPEPVAPMRLVQEVAAPPVSEPIAPQPTFTPAPAKFANTIADDETEITDLPLGETPEASVLSAVLKKQGLGLVECPVRPPMCPQAVMAVNRDRRLVILAVARQGLSELRSIGQAYRWAIENRPLLSMALPQFSIDTHALPCLRLLVDRADVSADLLQPMLESSNVTVQTYRKLKWGGKTGLLLEAA